MPSRDQSFVLDMTQPDLGCGPEGSISVGSKWDKKDLANNWKATSPEVEIDSPPQIFGSSSSQTSSPPQRWYALAGPEAGPSNPRSAICPNSPSRTANSLLRRRTTHRPKSYREIDSDQDSEGTGTEDKYVPSSSPKHGASSGRPMRTRARADPYHTSSASRAPPIPPRAKPSARNALAATLETEPHEDRYKCRYCGRLQESHRLNDLRRHERTHVQHLLPEEWVCRVAMVAFERKPDGKLQSVQWVHKGKKPYVGGCGRRFSRKDALKRHTEKLIARPF